MLVVFCVVTGSANTLLTKLADISSALGIDGTVHKFDHPYFQTLGMFVGEFLCFIAYHTCFNKQSAPGPLQGDSDANLVFAGPGPLDSPPRSYSVWIFALPTALDFISSCLVHTRAS